MAKLIAVAALIAPLAIAVPAEAYHHGYRTRAVATTVAMTTVPTRRSIAGTMGVMAETAAVAITGVAATTAISVTAGRKLLQLTQ